jgi:hypothetical protein
MAVGDRVMESSLVNQVTCEGGVMHGIILDGRSRELRRLHVTDQTQRESQMSNCDVVQPRTNR